MALTVVAKEVYKVVITVDRGRLNPVIKALIECGCFQPDPLRPGARGAQHVAVVRKMAAEAESLMSRIESIFNELGVPLEAGKVEVKVRDWMKDAESAIAEAYDVVDKAERLLRRLRELEGAKSDVARAYELMRKYSFIDFDLRRLAEMKVIKAGVYRVPVERLSVFEELIASTDGALAIIIKGVEDEYALAFTFCPAGLEVECDRAVLEARAEEVRIPEGLPGNPAEAVKVIEEEKRRIREELHSLLPKLREEYGKLEVFAAALRILEATALTRIFAVIRGFVDRVKYKFLIRKLDEETGGAYTIYTETRLAAREEGVTEISVPKPLKPFADLITLYGYPKPREIFPLILTAITFPILFGLMFPDLGHGLVILLFGALMFAGVLKLSENPEANRNFGLLLIYLGVAACIFGFLAGEFFGPHPAVAGWLDALWHGHPPYASPVHPMMKVFLHELTPAEAAHEAAKLTMVQIYISLAIGSVLLALASWLGVANAVLTGAKWEVPSRLSKAFIFTGIMLGFILAGSAAAAAAIFAAAFGLAGMFHITLPPAQQMIAMVVGALIGLGFLLAILSPWLGHAEEGMSKPLAAFMEAFDTFLLMIGNTISFVRIMGLMLAHSGLMFGFALLAFLVCGGSPTCGVLAAIGAAIVYILGNILTIGIESIAAFAHTLRLHFYEMFTKFFSGEGLPFKPIRLKVPAVIRVVE